MRSKVTYITGFMMMALACYAMLTNLDSTPKLVLCAVVFAMGVAGTIWQYNHPIDDDDE